MIRKALIPLPLLLLSFAACDRGGEEAMHSETPAEAGDQTASSGPAAPLGPVSSRGDQAGQPASGGAMGSGEAQASTLQFDVPKGWQSEPPASGMRIAQAKIPGAGGPGDLVVFYFGPGGGGGVEANVQRWIDQMDVTGTTPKAETFGANGFSVTWIDIAGTLKPSTMGTGPATEQPNSRLLGAVVEGPDGPWFFKATGPDATVSAERDNFLAMLKGVRGQ